MMALYERNVYPLTVVAVLYHYRHVALLGHIVLIQSQPVFACLAEKQHIPIILSLVLPDMSSNSRSPKLDASTLTITPQMRL